MVPGLLVLALVCGSVSVQAQDDWDVQNRVKRLENEIETLSRAVYKGEAPPPGSLPSGASANADVEIRLQQMETEMRDLRGMLEQQSYETRQLKDQLERMSSDLELRMNDLEGGAGASHGGAYQGGSKTRYTAMGNTPPQPAVNTNTAPGVGGGDGYQWSTSNTAPGQLGSYTESGSGSVNGADAAAATYENAFSLIKNRQYDRAQVEFQAFLNDHPDHPLAGNAQYWLGETYYVRGDYEKAARIFAEGYQKYPKGSKAADNLLKLGLSLDAMGKTGDACVALKQLKKENPAGAAPVLRRADQEMTRLGC